MSYPLFATPNDVVIDLKLLPAALFDLDTYSLLHEPMFNTATEKMLTCQDSVTTLTSGEFILIFEGGMNKMYGYLTPSYLQSWEIFLASILTQHPDLPSIEFHFVYQGNRSGLPFFFQSVRFGPNDVRFSVFQGEDHARWCFSLLPRLPQEDQDAYEGQNEDGDTNNKAKAVSMKEASVDDGALEEKVYRFDIDKYRASYRLYLKEKTFTNEQRVLFAQMEKWRSNF